jgi:hypothetical protein
MEQLFTKLEQFQELLKAVKAAVQMPKLPAPKMPKTKGMPGITPTSHKDPVKMTEQLHSASKDLHLDAAKRAKEALKTHKNGQWTLKSE